MPNSKFFSSILLISVITIFTAVVFAKPPKGMGGFGGKMPPVPVESIKIQAVKKSDQVTITGSVRASKGVVIKPEVDGRVTAIYFKPGETVTEGTKLIQLNQDILLANLRQNEAELKLAQQDQERFASLLKTHAVAKADFDKSFAVLRSKEAQKAMTEAQLRQKTIVAPFTGRVGLNLINVGAYVKVGEELVSLQSIDPIDVEFGVPEVYLNKIAVGNTINVRSDAFPGTIFKGTVYGIDSQVNSNTRTVLVRASVPNPEGKLLPGVFTEVDLAFTAEKPALVVPQTSIVYEAGDVYVYKIVDGKAMKTKVTLGARDQQSVIVLDGLKEGDVIVTAGQLKLSDGASVMVIK